MLDFMFFVKTLALTFLIVIAMQSKWGKHTVEEHTFDFIHSSVIMQPLQRTAASGVHVVQTSMAWLSQQVNQKFRGEKNDGNASFAGRASSFQWTRSEKAKSLDEAAERKSAKKSARDESQDSADESQ